MLLKFLSFLRSLYERVCACGSIDHSLATPIKDFETKLLAMSQESRVDLKRSLLKPNCPFDNSY